MVTSGGGWLLVGRSLEGGPQTPFGWNSDSGSVRNDDAPYSLGAFAHGFPFTEVVVGRRSTGKKLRSNAYRVTLPEAFFSDGATAPHQASAPVPVVGGCVPRATGSMLYRWGYTSLTTHFHFREVIPESDTGLRPYGFDTYFADCERGALLDLHQGLLFVR